jgi:hypothetical protein
MPGLSEGTRGGKRIVAAVLFKTVSKGTVFGTDSHVNTINRSAHNYDSCSRCASDVSLWVRRSIIHIDIIFIGDDRVCPDNFQQERIKSAELEAST